MAQDVVRSGRTVLEWPPRWSSVRWPTGWADVFDEDAMIRVEEVMEDDHTLLIRAEMPGVDPDKDVQITVENGVLTLQAERREEHENKANNGRRRHRSEFRYGSFVRSIVLPAGASDDDVKATFADGILEVRIPVNGAKAQAKTIPISRT